MFTKTRALPDTAAHDIKSLTGDSQSKWDEIYIMAPDSNSATIYVGDCAEQRIAITQGNGFNFKNTDLKEIYVKGSIGDEVTVVGV